MKTKEQKFYPLKSDLVFKSIFNEPNSLKRLIKETLNIDATDIKVVGGEQPIKNVLEKLKVLDLVVTSKDILTGKDMTTNIEINCNPTQATIIRNLVYYFTLVSANLKKAENYLEIDKHIQLNFTWNIGKTLGFDVKDQKKLVFHFAEDTLGYKLFPELNEIIHINMDYYAKNCYNEDENKFLRWLSVATKEEMKKIGKGDKFMEKVNKQVEKLNESEEFFLVVEIENDRELMLNSARYEGKLDGIKQGLKQGLEQGVKQTKIETAKSMFKDKMPVETISKYTGLSIEEINKLETN